MMKSITGKDQVEDRDEDEIDRVLSRGDELLPSSGFATSVMEAVRREAAAPPAIPFPWKRALPGLVVGACTLIGALVTGVAAIVRLASGSVASQAAVSTLPALPSLFHGGIQSAAIWTILALLMAFVSVRLSTRTT
jgi:hypothetical protein